MTSWQKPIKLILRFILLHGRPNSEDPADETSWEKRPWVMDAGCGSGTASLAAILLGMNAYAFDERQHCVDGTIARLADWTNQLVDSDMAQPPSTIKKRKSRGGEDDVDLLEEGDVGDDDEGNTNRKMTDEEIETLMESAGDQDVAVEQEDEDEGIEKREADRKDTNVDDEAEEEGL